MAQIVFSMKKCLFFLMLVVAPLCSTAQFFYNPYISPQAAQRAYEQGRRIAEEMSALQEAAAQRGYEQGRRMAEKMSAQQEANDKKDPIACVNRISKAIVNRNFTLAEEWAINMSNVDKSNSYYWLGLVNELQGNSSYAKSYYKEGVELGDDMCYKAWARLVQEGPLTEAQINNIVQYFANLEVMAEVMAWQMTNDIWNNSSGYNNSGSSIGSSRRVCPSCNGSKKGTDKIYYRTDYTGNQANEYCPTCNKWTSPHSHSTSSCPVCYGRGYVE